MSIKFNWKPENDLNKCFKNLEELGLVPADDPVASVGQASVGSDDDKVVACSFKYLNILKLLMEIIILF